VAVSWKYREKFEEISRTKLIQILCRVIANGIQRSPFITVYHNFTVDQYDRNSKLPSCTWSSLTKIYRYTIDGLGSDFFSQTAKHDLRIRHF